MRASLSRKTPAAPAGQNPDSTQPRRAFYRLSRHCPSAPHHPANTAAHPSRQLPCEP